MSIATSSPVTEGVLAALATVIPSTRVGDGVKPPSPNPPPASFYPYLVVYTGLDLLDGNLLEPKEDGLHRVQVTSIGKDRIGAEWLRDQVREVLLDRDAVTITGHAVTWTELVTSQPIGRDDDVVPPLFFAVDIFHLFVTPI